jgi:spermidine synthase
VRRFVDIELLVAFVGGTSAAALFFVFGGGRYSRPVLYGEILLVGTLVGLEIPLLLRIRKDEMEFKELVSKVLTLDDIGSLAISFSFPLFFVPRLGLLQTTLVLGLANTAVALWSGWIFGSRISRTRGIRLRCSLVIALLVAGIAASDRLLLLSETWASASSTTGRSRRSPTSLPTSHAPATSRRTA